MKKPMASVVLLPNEDDRKRLVDFSSRLAEVAETKIQLSAKRIPHITLVQFQADESELEKIWRNVRQLAGSVPELFSGGLGFVPDSQGLLWVELGFLKSELFITLQSAITASKTVQEFEMHGYVGDRYRPHSTLGLMDGAATLPVLKLEHETIFSRPFQNLKLAVGVNGDHWTLTKISHSE